MQKPKKITLAWLKKHGACIDAQEAFRKTFPKGLSFDIVSISTVRRYESNHGSIGHLDWLASKLLNTETYYRYYRTIFYRKLQTRGSWNLLVKLLKEQNGRRR